MIEGRTLQELAIELDRQRESKKDFIADSRSTKMEVVHTVNTGVGTPVFRIGEQEPVAIRGTFHQQMGNNLSIPKAYYDKMLQSSPELLANNVNHWMNSSPSRNLLRILDGHARARLSDAFRPLDNDDLLEAILPAFADAGVQVKSCQVTERRLYLQAVTDKLVAEVKVGQPIHAGIVISNSEIGFGAIRAETLLYFLTCLNGQVSGIALRKTHLGRRAEIVEGAAEFYRDDTRRADDRAFFLKLRDTVAGVLSKENFERKIDELRDATDRKITGDPIKAVEVLQTKIRLTDGEKGSVLRNLIEGGDLSAYGLANAVTAAANNHDSYDRAVDLERMGAKVIELPKSDWTHIAEAA